MPTLLVIESSPRGDRSVSRKLTAEFVADWQQAHPGGTVVTRDLMKTPLSFVDVPWITGAYTPPEQHSPEVKQALRLSDELIAELMQADHIVVGTSMYNFSIPAALKAYVDQIVRVGVTFSANYEGLVKGKKLFVLLASGGVYTPGAPAEAYNVAGSYLKQVFGFIGITDSSIVLAGGTAGIDRGTTTLPELLAQFSPEVAALAKGIAPRLPPGEAGRPSRLPLSRAGGRKGAIRYCTNTCTCRLPTLGTARAVSWMRSSGTPSDAISRAISRASGVIVCAAATWSAGVPVAGTTVATSNLASGLRLSASSTAWRSASA